MVITNKIRKIIFFNSPSEIDGYLAYNTKNLEADKLDCLFIAMNPIVRSYLKQRGISAQDTLPYFTNDSHMRALEKSELIIEWLRKETNFLDLGLGIKRAYKDSFIFFTRCSIHYCLWTIEVILNVIAVHNPQIICASYSRGKVVPSLYIESEEKYLGYVVKLIAQVKNLRFENIPTSIIYNLSFLKYVNNYAQALAKFIIKSISFNLLKKRILKNISWNGKPILFTSKLYQMDKLITEIQGELKGKLFYVLNLPIVAFFNVPNFAIKLLWKRYSKTILSQKRSFKDLEEKIWSETEVFSYRRISFASIISQKIQNNIANYIVSLYIWAVRLNNFIDSVKPSAIISNGERFDDVILAEMFNRKKIPAILVSHGSHVPPKNRYEYIEWRENNRALLDAPFSYLALQTPLAEAYLNVFPTESKTIRTGPLLWGKPVNRKKSELLFKKLFKSKYNLRNINVILHAGTPKPSNSLRFYVYETPDEYIQSLYDLATAIEEIPNVVLIIKFRPSKEISVESLKRFVPFSEKVILSIDESFIDVLGLADLLVSFSSTTIEEALQNKIPVLLYGGGGRYQHIPAYELEVKNSVHPSALFHVKDPRSLGYVIRGVLELLDNSKINETLFSPYIYTEEIRVSLIDLLRLCSSKKGEELLQ